MSAVTGQRSMPKCLATSEKIADSVTRFCGVPVPCACTKLRLRRLSSPRTARVAAAALATLR